MVLCGGALCQSITHTPHAHQHWLQLLLEQFGWLFQMDFPQLSFAASPAFPCCSLPSRQHHTPRPGTVTPSSTGQGQPALSRSCTGTGSKVKMRAGYLVKGWSPYSFGVTPDRGPSVAQLSLHNCLARETTQPPRHVLITCVQLHSSQSEWRGTRATGKETLLWDTEPPSQAPLTK